MIWLPGTKVKKCNSDPSEEVQDGIEGIIKLSFDSSKPYSEALEEFKKVGLGDMKVSEKEWKEGLYVVLFGEDVYIITSSKIIV